MVVLDKSEFAEWKTKDNYYYSETKKLLDFYNKKNYMGVLSMLLCSLTKYVGTVYPGENSIINEININFNKSFNFSKNHIYIKPFSYINCTKDDDFISLDLKRKKLEIKSPELFGDNWKDELSTFDKKIIEDYFKRCREKWL